MASSSSNQETDSKISRIQRISKNETYKERLLRRIASGGSSSAQATKLFSVCGPSLSTTRSSNPSAPVVTQESRKISLPNVQSKNLNHNTNNKGPVTTDTPKTELKFSKIVSMAFLIGPNLESKSGTPSSTKNAPILVVKKTKDKQRENDAVTISEPTKKDRESTENAPAQISSVTTKNRKRKLPVIPESPNKVRRIAAAPESDKGPINHKLRLRILPRTNKLVSSNDSTMQSDLKAPIKNPGSNGLMETAMQSSIIDEKKRKNDAKTTSATAKRR
ncbi:hypothetical protein M436DRAFT_82274 [Aureobasidium namibiae CBS 147.97]|uniref:Uncharacterized protein n=1 Tax=Aureobasidium namibiae CBS 147.97 TaxID=1043004 RepID=A0A074WIZ0_9PEZI